MNLPTLGWMLLGGVVAWFIPDALSRWQSWRILRGIMRRAEHPERFPPPAPREPEGRFVVHLSEHGVSCHHPAGRPGQVAWADLRRVEILTTDDGPFAPDVFWVLSGTGAGFAIPQGAAGEKELSGRLGQLPGFSHEAVIRAMGRTANARFLCWQRTP